MAAAWAVHDVRSTALATRGEFASESAGGDGPRQPCGCAAAWRCRPHGQRDAWARTFYDPLLVKANAAARLTRVPAQAEATADVDCSMAPLHQFDQVGAYVYVNDDCFVKAGLEFTDGAPRLSVVVTNGGWSDWSTQDWPRWDGTTMAVRVRVHKVQRPQGACVVVEADTSAAAAPACAPSARPTWTFVRIAPLHAPPEADWLMGYFAACPVQGGAEACFHHVTVGDLQPLSHATDSGSA